MENAVRKKPLPREECDRKHSNSTSRRPTMNTSTYKNSLSTKKSRLWTSLHSQQMEFVFRRVLSKWQRETWGWRKTHPAGLTGAPCCRGSLGQTSKCKSGTLTDMRSCKRSNSCSLSYTTSKHWLCLCSDGDLWPLGTEGFYLTRQRPYTCCLHPQMRCDLRAFCTLETSIFGEVLFIAVQQWTQKYSALKMIKL